METTAMVQEFEVLIQLRSVLDYYGSKGLKARRINPTAASKARAILNGAGQNSLTNQTPKVQQANASDTGSQDHDDPGSNKRDKDVSGPTPRVAKSYGSHNGSTHVATFMDERVTPDNLQEVLVYIANICSKFENLPSADVRTMKRDYLAFRDKYLAEKTQEYGTITSEKVSAQILTDLAEKSFEYTRSQIEIVIKSNLPFVGAQLMADGKYVRRLKSKTIYAVGHTLLSRETLKALKDSPKKESVVIRTTALRYGGRIEVDPKSGLRIFRIDFGQLSNHVRDMDSY